jgi:predicted NAD/FAD-dependent oxidoreductase
MVRGENEGRKDLRDARITLFTSRGKLATQMGPKNQTIPKAGKPFFDYGCQYFTSTTPWFRQEVDRWEKLGYLTAIKEGELGMLSETNGFTPIKGDSCWVGNGGMGPMLTKLIDETVEEFSGIVEHVAGFPDANMSVKRIAKTTCGWELGNQNGSPLGTFDFVIGGFAQHVLTDPFLLSGGQASEKMLQCLRRVESNQLIPIQISFEGEPIPADFTAAHVYGEESLSFVSNNSRKPQQNGKMGTAGPQHWTLLSTASFAEREFNTNPKGYRTVAQEQMLNAFSRLLGIADLASSSGATKHRPVVNRINHWEDGLAAKTPPSSRGCLFDADVGLGWCGDFCTLPGIEGAALSGQAMAMTLAEFIGSPQNFDRQGFLPFDQSWVPFQPQGSTMVDIGAFSGSLGLPSNWTHTDLVPSAIHGYNSADGLGAAGRRITKGKGKGANSYNTYSEGEKNHKGKGKGSNSYNTYSGKNASKGKSW